MFILANDEENVKREMGMGLRFRVYCEPLTANSEPGLWTEPLNLRTYEPCTRVSQLLDTGHWFMRVLKVLRVLRFPTSKNNR